MKLRNFLYPNTKVLDDHLSAIDGFSYSSEVRTESRSECKNGGFEVGVPTVKGKGQRNKNYSEEIKREVQVSDPAKFDRIYDYLTDMRCLKYFEAMNDSEFDVLSRDDFLDVLVTPRFSKAKAMFDTAKKVNELATTLQSLSDQPLMSKKDKEMLGGLVELTKINSSAEISCVFNFEGNKFPLIAYLPMILYTTNKGKIFSFTDNF
jgi:hypothetical protein